MPQMFPMPIVSLMVVTMIICTLVCIRLFWSSSPTRQGVSEKVTSLSMTQIW